MPNETPAMLPGFEPDARPAGEMERQVQQQIEKLRDLGFIEAHHAGLVQLALVTARDIDQSFGRGAPSGRANLIRVMNEVLAALPQPEAASKDKLDQVVDAIMHDDEDDEDVDAARASA